MHICGIFENRSSGEGRTTAAMLKSIKMSLNYRERVLVCQAEQCAPVNQFQGRTLNTFAHRILVSQSSRKAQHSPALVETMRHRPETARISSSGVLGSPWQLACPPHTLVVWQQKEPVLSLQRADRTEGLAGDGRQRQKEHP